MIVSRRAFLQYCGLSAVALGLDRLSLLKLEEALAAPGAPSVIWLQGSSCCGCSVALLDRIAATGSVASADDLLLNYIDLAFHPTLMTAAGQTAVNLVKKQMNLGKYILVVEGGVATAFDGKACIVWSDNGIDVTCQDALRNLAQSAAQILCIGTCSSYGGMPAAGVNPTGIVPVGKFLNKPTINIPGCPCHPDWFVWVVVQLLMNKPIALDTKGRPKVLFGQTVHRLCPYRDEDETETFGLNGRCLKELGCRGPTTYCNCPKGKWNNGVNWCAQAGAPCIGCTEPTFPGSSALFSHGDDLEDSEEEEDD